MNTLTFIIAAVAIMIVWLLVFIALKVIERNPNAEEHSPEPSASTLDVTAGEAVNTVDVDALGPSKPIPTPARTIPKPCDQPHWPSARSTTGDARRADDSTPEPQGEQKTGNQSSPGVFYFPKESSSTSLSKQSSSSSTWSWGTLRTVPQAVLHRRSSSSGSNQALTREPTQTPPAIDSYESNTIFYMSPP
ncbi:hypothetical protein AAL_02283 [Moelleriella libera RCEF 2490]|uniref:Uncharacterized protein n=1 Tax=Moelleriella libera RCEF 2490 TaxID=1081109 RepID=A0A168FC55_9HYPO|nr:hypothetical protein AAL_02283 [Moelleriella libera RCEF 2490]